AVEPGRDPARRAHRGRAQSVPRRDFCRARLPETLHPIPGMTRIFVAILALAGFALTLLWVQQNRRATAAHAELALARGKWSEAEGRGRVQQALRREQDADLQATRAELVAQQRETPAPRRATPAQAAGAELFKDPQMRLAVKKQGAEATERTVNQIV